MSRGNFRRLPPEEQDRQQACEMRDQFRRWISYAEKNEKLAAMLGTPGGVVLLEMLEEHVTNWEKHGSWTSDDPRDRGRAERSKWLLEMLRNAGEAAKGQRAEAERLARILAEHEKSGRIQPDPEAR